jgi:hypothetical protein
LRRLSTADDLQKSAVETAGEVLVANSVLNPRLNLVVQSAIHALILVDKIQCALEVATEQTTILERF